MGKFYVTTPIYYPNDVPHIGHAYTTVAGDVLTRWRRMWGDDVFFLTGLDEHGQKIFRTAQEQGVEPQQFVDAMAPRFTSVWELLGIRNDDFIRTSDERHRAAVQAFLQAVYDAGDIELGTYEGLYCVNCEAYYTEDELHGGDCPIHERPVERVQEENYFFKLSRYEQRLLDHYQAHPEAVRPEIRLNEVLGFIKQGLADFSMSRTSIDWGVPLPWDGKHVTYVWFDALFNYCSAIGYGADDERFRHYWPVDYHLIGKDILRFHAVYWPAMLMAAGLDPPQCVYAHGFLMVGGKKMSKTGLTQIHPADLVEEFGVDGFRYHFLRDLQFGPDGDFSYESMVARYNADLANNFGNLANRVLAMSANYLGGVTPEGREDALSGPAHDAFERLCSGLERLDFAGGFGAVWDLIGATNAYIEDRQPWELNKAGEAAKVADVLGDCLEALRLVALLAAPLIPGAASELWRRLGLPGTPEDQRLPSAAEWGQLPGGLALERGTPLFPRIDT
ncbi:MAG: methionine--tRNA ligase [Actinobacteria bacterium]|nr:methionine--tRNA ligase [Actinomycetota bacterium]